MRNNAASKEVDNAAAAAENPCVSEAAASPAPRIPWWLWPNVLSLDAPLVAVFWQAGLAKAHKVAVMPSLHLTLFLAVWLIYMVDRVLDGFSMKHVMHLSARHAFYRRNRWLFVLLVLPAAALLLFLLGLTAIPEGIFWRGIALGFVVALYLLHYAARGHRGIYLTGNLIACAFGGYVLWSIPVPLHYKLIYSTVLLSMLTLAFASRPGTGLRLMPKEVLCGFLFAVGCSMSVHFFTGDAYAGWFSWESLLLAVLCALNCIAISCYEKETDAQSDPNAITRTWPHIARVYPVLLLTLVVAVLAAMSRRMPVELVLYSVAVLISAVLLGVVHHLAKRITPEMAHVLADAAVVLPVALLLVAW